MTRMNRLTQGPALHVRLTTGWLPSGMMVTASHWWRQEQEEEEEEEEEAGDNATFGPLRPP